jgi:hypothetical protein
MLMISLRPSRHTIVLREGLTYSTDPGTGPIGPLQSALLVAWLNSSGSPEEQEQKMREFATGATRDVEDNKYDFEGFFSVQVLDRRARYMHHHRKQADGHLRDSDNWQKGIPLPVYMKSAFRHFIDWWRAHRNGNYEAAEDAICALMFNCEGYLHEILKPKETKP